MAKKEDRSKASGRPAFGFMNHGGKRKGAGRKARRHSDGSRVESSHERRPRFTKSRPLHVTLEVTEDVPNLRAASMAPVVCDAIGRANRRENFRVAHFCLLGTHVHLICKADGPEALARGMKSLNGTLAKAINGRLGRKGRVIASRFHLHVLRTKTEVRSAVQYVLRNAERHGLHEVRGTRSGMASNGFPCPDPLSTAAWFPYWAERELLVAPRQIPASLIRPARCYLMKLAFEGAPLSFAAPMRRTTGTPRHRSKARAEPAVERGRATGTAPNRGAAQRVGRRVQGR